MDQPGAVLFDAYGTLFDVYSVGQTAERLFAGQGQALAAGWRDKQIEYTRLVTTSNHGAHYRPFGELTRAALRGFFEVNRHHIVLATLDALARAGRIERALCAQAIGRYGIDTDADASWSC